MKPEIKKLLILNLPYLLFVWLFDKVGAAVRLSPGADASAKLLHLGDGFSAAFSSIAPSFHPADLALGIAGAAIVRLIIYVKGKKQLTKPPQGKQSLKQLMKQNAGVSNIEITKDNIKAFEGTAKKYGIDFALKKDTTENPPRYLVFFKGRDADALTAAFKEFSAKKLTQDRKPSIRKLLTSLKEAAQGRNAQREKVKNKDRGREL